MNMQTTESLGQVFSSLFKLSYMTNVLNIGKFSPIEILQQVLFTLITHIFYQICHQYHLTLFYWKNRRLIMKPQICDRKGKYMIQYGMNRNYRLNSNLVFIYLKLLMKLLPCRFFIPFVISLQSNICEVYCQAV